MNNTDVLRWIKKELGETIQKAIAARPGSAYTEEWLAGIGCRETGGLLALYIPKRNDVAVICSILRGDFTQRPGETAKQYHGYGITQIDIASFPQFVKSGDWKDPYKCFLKTIDILNGKKQYLVSHFPSLAGNSLNHYVTASYNCGEGNERKVIEQHLDPDAYTTQHNYSNEVFEFADIYKNL